MLTISLTFLPPLLIILFIIFTDKLKEPTSLIVSTFFLGCMLCLPAGLLNYLIIVDDNYSFLAGLTEETLKFLALYFYIKDKKEFDEPMDAVVYGCLISLGFATYENFEYVYFYELEISPLEIAIIRATSAIPLHACCGILMGYYFIFYHFRKKRIYLWYSLLIPILVHAFYNFLCDFNDYMVYAYVIGLIIFTIFSHNKIRLQQKKMNPF